MYVGSHNGHPVYNSPIENLLRYFVYSSYTKCWIMARKKEISNSKGNVPALCMCSWYFSGENISALLIVWFTLYYMTHMKKIQKEKKNSSSATTKDSSSNPALCDLQILKKPRRVDVEVKLYVCNLCIISCLVQSELRFKQPHNFTSIQV